MTRRRGVSNPIDPVTRLRLREPVDVLAAVPYVLGYHPTDSVVVIGLAGRRLLFATRDDLPAAEATSSEVGTVIAHLHGLVVSQGADGALIVGYGQPERVDPVTEGLHAAFDGAGVCVLEVLRTTGERYWSYLCHDPACCPAEGAPYDVTSSTIAAQATLSGRVALADRVEFERQIAPAGDHAAMSEAAVRADARLFALIRTAPDELGAFDALVAEGRTALAAAVRRYRRGGRLDDDEVAWLSMLVASPEVRDLV
jgi:Domain of unknown function (DUF4192)